MHFKYDNAAINLRSLYILLSKDGGGREFWLLNRLPDIIATALCPDEPEWGSSIEELRRKANAFIKKMRKETPYWLDYPLFDPLVALHVKLPRSEALDRVRMLPLMSRVQLAYLIKRGGAPAASSTDFAIRSLGIEADKSLALAVDLGLLRMSSDPQIALNALSKDTLLDAASNAGILLRKSWAKAKIISTMETAAPGVVRALQDANPMFEVEPRVANDLNALIQYTEENTSNVSLLAFA